MSEQPSEAVAGDADDDAGDGAEPAAPGKPWWRREFRYFVEILAVAGFAVAQPVLSSFGESPETFVTAGATPAVIVVFAAAVVVLPALAVWALAAATGVVGQRARGLTQAGAVGAVVAVFGLWAFREWLSSEGFATAAALVVGVLAAVAYRRLAAARLYLTFASVAPVAFLAMFLGASPVHLLVFEPEPAKVGSGDADASVVVIVVDELPTASLLDGDDEIDADLYPNLARFAGDATFFRNNTTVATYTDAALPAILTGRYPSERKAVRRDYSENLFTLLSESHDLNVHEAITALCPASRCERRVDGNALRPLARQAWRLWTGLVTGSDRPAATRSAGRAAAAEQASGLDELLAGRLDQTERFVASLDGEGGRPTLDMVHLLLPHQPWELLPDGRRYPKAQLLSNFLGHWTTDTGALLARQRHLLQARYADRVLGRVLDRLKELGRYDDSMIVVVGDHGVSFRTDEHFRGGLLTPQNAPEILWTPLLVKSPGQTRGGTSDRNTQTVDVVPTVADAVGVELPWATDGRSLIDGEPLPPSDKRYLPGWIPDEQTLRRWGHPTRPAIGDIEKVDGVDGYARMLEIPPASAVDSNDPLALYRLPPYTDLVGTPVADLIRGPPADMSVRLDDPGRFRNVDPEASTVPVYVSGVVESKGEEERRIVVAVNGTVGGWGGVEADFFGDAFDWPQWIGVLVPPSLLQSGPNTIEVFVMEGEPGTVTIHPVDVVR